MGGKSMKVLVTGVNGQLGYDVMNELNQEDMKQLEVILLKVMNIFKSMFN